MGIYEGLKDALSIVQKADNVDLYRQLLDLMHQAIEMQAEIETLKKENCELKKAKNLSDRIIRHQDPVITLKDDADGLFYCGQCWDGDGKLVQLTVHKKDKAFYCQRCKMCGYFD